MADPKTLEEALVVIKGLEASVAKVPELEKLVEGHLVTISGLRDEVAKHPAAVQVLQAKLTEATTAIKASEGLPAQVKTLTDSQTALTAKLTNGFVTRLTSLHGLKEDIVKGKSIAELEAMEVALIAVHPKGGQNPPINPRGTGLLNGQGGGGADTKTSKETDLALIEAASARNKK